MEQIITELKTIGLDVGLKIIAAIVIIVVGFRVIKMLEKYFKKGKHLTRVDASVKVFIINFSSIALKVLTLICAATVLGIPMTSIITLVGSFALALGLALQGGLSNLAGGLMILIFKPFKYNDYIETSDKEGKVTGITLFYTILTTYDNKKIMLPNGALTNEAITNYTALGKRRVDVDYPVSYKSNINEVKKILLDIIRKQKNYLPGEEIFIAVTKYDSSAIIVTTRAWVNTDLYWPTKYYMLEEGKKAFDQNNIEIPFDQVDVHIKEK